VKLVSILVSNMQHFVAPVLSEVICRWMQQHGGSNVTLINFCYCLVVDFVMKVSDSLSHNMLYDHACENRHPVGKLHY